MGACIHTDTHTCATHLHMGGQPYEAPDKWVCVGMGTGGNTQPLTGIDSNTGKYGHTGRHAQAIKPADA